MPRKKGYHKPFIEYPDSLKQQVIREYQSGCSFGYLCSKYGIKSRTTVGKWLRSHGIVVVRRNYYLSGVKKTPSKSAAPIVSGTKEASVEQQIKALQEQLFDAQLRAEMLERMIEIAEQDHQISIRKKGGTK